jgi:hypothetical protein
MILLTVSEDLSAIASILQAIVAIGAFVLLYSTFKLQAFTFLEQMKVTKSQQKIQEIEVMRHRVEIKPRFDIEWFRNDPTQYSYDPEGIYAFRLTFKLNENPTPTFQLKIKECSKEIQHYYGDKAPYPSGELNAKYVFTMEFRYPASDQSIEALRALRLYIIFGANFTDIKGNEYEQTLTYVSHIEPYFFVQEPKILKIVDIS